MDVQKPRVWALLSNILLAKLSPWNQCDYSMSRNDYSACAVKRNLTHDISLLMKNQDIKQGTLNSSNTQNVLLKLALLIDRLFSVANSRIKGSFQTYYNEVLLMFPVSFKFSYPSCYNPLLYNTESKSNLIYSYFPASCFFISFLFLFSLLLHSYPLLVASLT